MKKETFLRFTSLIAVCFWNCAYRRFLSIGNFLVLFYLLFFFSLRETESTRLNVHKKSVESFLNLKNLLLVN